tara:strand:+ start:383 stop:613 length:231 start_codon:yes stop_codon:yes gene_type:complete
VKFSIGELVYDPRHRKVGMVKTIETLTRIGAAPHGDAHYGIHFFDDTYCAEGNVRLMYTEHADNILEAYENNCSSR